MTPMERRCRDNLSQFGRTLRERAHDPAWDVNLLLREMVVIARDWQRHLDGKPVEFETIQPVPRNREN